MERYDLPAEKLATPEEAGVLRIASEVDEKNCGCVDAAITPSNLYNLLGCRKASTAYVGNEVVACPYHTEFLLKCVQAGSTATGSLDTTNVTSGQVITDGGVKWEVIAKAIIDASISGKNITLKFADNSTKTLTTQNIFPNFNAFIVKAWDIEYTAEADGWIYAWRTASAGSTTVYAQIYVNGVEAVHFHYYNANNGVQGSSCFVPVAKGDKYKIAGKSDKVSHAVFYPCRGV